MLKVRHIPVRTISAPVAMRRLSRRIRTCERRYEIPSAKMVEDVSCGKMLETVEVIKWMHAYHVLQLLKQKTHTTGIRSTITKQSMKHA